MQWSSRDICLPHYFEFCCRDELPYFFSLPASSLAPFWSNFWYYILILTVVAIILYLSDFRSSVFPLCIRIYICIEKLLTYSDLKAFLEKNRIYLYFHVPYFSKHICSITMSLHKVGSRSVLHQCWCSALAEVIFANTWNPPELSIERLLGMGAGRGCVSEDAYKSTLHIVTLHSLLV